MSAMPVPLTEVPEAVVRAQHDLASLERQAATAASVAGHLERQLVELGAPTGSSEVTVRRFQEHLRALRAETEREVAGILAAARAGASGDEPAAPASEVTTVGSTEIAVPEAPEPPPSLVGVWTDDDLELAFWKDDVASWTSRLPRISGKRVPVPRISVGRISVGRLSVGKVSLRRIALPLRRSGSPKLPLVRALEGSAAVLAVTALALRLG
jgi:hypothetical protein